MNGSVAAGTPNSQFGTDISSEYCGGGSQRATHVASSAPGETLRHQAGMGSTQCVKTSEPIVHKKQYSYSQPTTLGNASVHLQSLVSLTKKVS